MDYTKVGIDPKAQPQELFEILVGVLYIIQLNRAQIIDFEYAGPLGLYAARKTPRNG